MWIFNIIKHWEGSPESFWMDGRFQDEDDYQERKQQEASQREKRHLEHFSTVGAEITDKRPLSAVKIG